MPAPIRRLLSRHGISRWAFALWLIRRSPPPLRRWLWARTARQSAFTQRHLAGLKGIEIGASAHNDFGIDAINVDRYHAGDTVYKQEEWSLCGRIRHVDLVAPGDQLPFKDNAVDFVFSSHVLEHFPDPIKALKEWVRVSRKFVLVFVPHRDRTFDSERDLTPIEEVAGRHETRFESDEDRHWTVWTCESFLEMCERFGFRVLDHQDPDDKVGNGFAVLIDATSVPRPMVAGTGASRVAVRR
jgi:SAM-dependent methyltransferase